MEESAAPVGPVTWHILGGVAVEVGGVSVALGPRLRYALGCLLAEPGRGVAADTLAGDAAPGPDQAATAGRVAIRRLRVALEDAGICGSISTTPAGYALDVDPLLVDHVAFTRWCEAADGERWPDAAWRYADRARRAWRGRPFGDLADAGPFQASAAALEEQHRLLVDRWGDLVLRAGTHERAVAVLADDVAAEPLRERRWAALALARYRSGNQVAALRTLADARRELVEAVGVEPGRELQVLEQQVLAQDPELDWRPSHTLPSGHLVGGPVVVGRAAEVHEVVDLLDRHRIVVLEGPAGIGKTTVAAEVCRHVKRPSVWVSVGTVDTAGLVPAVAAALDLPDRGAGHDDVDAVARHLHRSAALLVLDGFGDSTSTAVDPVTALVTRAPDVRVLITSRSSLPILHGIQRPLAPLRIGEPAEPGPAALLAADFASIPRSRIAEEWVTIDELCRRSGGVPLALRLLAGPAEDAASTGPPSSTDLVGDAARAALGRLAPRAVDLVTTLADLPVPVTVSLVARILTAAEPELRPSLGAAARAGLVSEVSSGDVSRVRVLEPIAEVLRPHGPDPGTTSWLATRIAEVTVDLIDASMPSLVGRVDLGGFAAVDDDHDAVAWALDHLPDQARLRLASRLAVVWSACGRNLEGGAVLADLEPLVESAPPIERVRYWAMRAQISPALSGRTALAAHLEDAISVADRLGHDDLAVRCMTEVALGRIWTGDGPGAVALLDACERRVVLDEFGRLTLATLRAMLRALDGDIGGACDDLLRIADAFDDAGMAPDAVGVLHIALSLSSLGGDEERSGRILEVAATYAPDRFTGYAVAAMRYRQAQRLMAEDDQLAGPMLFDAYGALHRHGDGQWAASCLADLGWWRANHDDPGGLADLATAALDLIEVWSSGAALALARLAVLSSRLGRPDDAHLFAAAAAHQPEGGVSPSPADRDFVTATCGDLTDGTAEAPAQGVVTERLTVLSLG